MIYLRGQGGENLQFGCRDLMDVNYGKASTYPPFIADTKFHQLLLVCNIGLAPLVT